MVKEGTEPSMKNHQAAENGGRISPGRIGKLLAKAAGILLSLVSLAGLYFALVIAQPQTEKNETKEQPPLAASQGRSIASEGELAGMIRDFPAPVMSFMSGSGMVFVSAEVRDVPWKSGYGRILTQYWQTAAGEPLILQSIYPAEGMELMGKGGYSFSGTAGPTLFGLASVRMEDGETVRVHVQAEGEGLYALTVPKPLEGSLSWIARSIQLFTAEKAPEEGAE